MAELKRWLTTGPLVRVSARVVIFATVVGSVSFAAAQLRTDQPVESFEVASVRPREKAAFRRAAISALPGGRFEASNASLRDLIWYAYGLQRPQTVEGGPPWVVSDRFEIIARARQDLGAAVGGTPESIRRMVQDLLAKRFNLALHWEKRTQRARALVLARSDGRLGPQLRRSTLDCVAFMEGQRVRILAGEDSRAPRAPENRAAKCSVITTNGRTVAAGHTMSQFAVTLSLLTGDIVVDRTGLTGPFSIEMTAVPYNMPPAAQADARSGGVDFPPLEAALREQLGLKLEVTQVDVETVIIDRVERPTEN